MPGTAVTKGFSFSHSIDQPLRKHPQPGGIWARAGTPGPAGNSQAALQRFPACSAAAAEAQPKPSQSQGVANSSDSPQCASGRSATMGFSCNDNISSWSAFGLRCQQRPRHPGDGFVLPVGPGHRAVGTSGPGGEGRALDTRLGVTRSVPVTWSPPRVPPHPSTLPSLSWPVHSPPRTPLPAPSAQLLPSLPAKSK